MYDYMGVGGLQRVHGPQGAESGRWGMVGGSAVWVRADGGGARGECGRGWRMHRGQ